MKKTKVLSLIIALMLIFTSTIVFAEGESTDTETSDGNTATFELEMDTETGETEFYRGETVNVEVIMKSDDTQTGIQGFEADVDAGKFELQKDNLETEDFDISISDEGHIIVTLSDGKLETDATIEENQTIATIPFKIKDDAELGNAPITIKNIVGGYVDDSEDYSYTGSSDDLEITILEGTRPDDNEEGDTEEGDTEEGDTEEGISEIDVDEEPDTTEYKKGDVFGPTGMQFTVKYLNDDKKTIAVVVDDEGDVTLFIVDKDGNVTEEFDNGTLTWEPEEELTTDDDKIVFTYTDEEENEAEFEIEITVTEEEPEEPTEDPEEPTKPTETSKSDSEPKKETTAKEDSKEATGKIPQTGMPSIIIPSAIGIALIIVAVVSYKKYKKLF